MLENGKLIFAMILDNYNSILVTKHLILDFCEI